MSLLREVLELWRKPYGPIVFVAAWLGGPVAARAALRFYEDERKPDGRTP